MAVLTRAGPAEILRASQKDELFCEKLRNLMHEFVLNVGGTRVLLKYRDLVSAVGNLMYYSATTLSGLQTLGEEYTGILQFDTSQGQIPTGKNRILMVLLSEFGQKLLGLMLEKMEKSDCLQKETSELRVEARQHLLSVLAYLKVMLPFMEQLHRAAFYCTGFYYHLSKRITGVQYILVRYWLKNRDSLYGFKLLSVITTIQTLLSGTMKSIQFWRQAANERMTSVSVVKGGAKPTSGKTCPLCLDERKNVSLTPCGHLFCWYCIHEWLQSERKCPICRETVLPSRVVPLRNYS